MTLAQTILGPDTLTPVSIIAAVVGCTVLLVWRARGLVESVTTLTVAVKDLTASNDRHVLESNVRDMANQREHAALARCCDSNVEAIKGANHRLSRVETVADTANETASTLASRVAVLENA